MISRCHGRVSHWNKLCEKWGAKELEGQGGKLCYYLPAMEMD